MGVNIETLAIAGGILSIENMKVVMAFRDILVLAAMITVSIDIKSVSANPVQSDALWENPCDGSTFVSRNSITRHRRQALTADIELLKFKARTAWSLCNEILNRIIPVMGSRNAVFLNNQSPLVGFPENHASFTSGMNIRELLLSHLEDLSAVGVFLDQMFLDTVNFYNKEQRDLEHKYRDISCQMHRILHTLNQEVTSQVSRSIMPNVYRNIDVISERHRRNYLIIRDTRAFFNSISTSLDAYIGEVLL